MASPAASSTSLNRSSSSSDGSVSEETGEEALTTASTPTLVNEPPSLRLMFSRNNVMRATLCSAAGPEYKVSTNSRVSRTDLWELAEGRERRVIATIKRRDILPDVVIFAHRQGKSVRVNKWLQQSKPPDGRSLLQTLFGCFTWRSDNRHRLALYREDQTEFPIAYYKKVETPPTLALVLRPGFESIRIEVITSFIILEHRLRTEEKVREGEMVFGRSGNGVLFVTGY